MAIKNCAVEFQNALSDVMTKQESKEFYKSLNTLSDMKQRKGNLSRVQALSKSRDEMIDLLRKQEAQQKKELLINLNAKKNLLDSIDKFSDKIEGLKAQEVGSRRQVEGARAGAEQEQKAIQAQVASKLLNELEKGDLLTTFKDKDAHINIAEELFGNGTGDAKAKKVADIIKGCYSGLVSRLNYYGANIIQLKDFIANQTHDGQKLQLAAPTFKERMNLRYQLYKKHGSDFQATRQELNEIAYTRWKNFILPLLDDARTFENVPDDEIEGFMRSAYNNIVFKRSLNYTTDPLDETSSTKEKLDDLYAYAGPANLGKRLSQSRVFHFKDGKSWYQYNEEYGTGNFASSIYSTMENSSKAIGLMKKFGSNPRAMYNNLSKQIFAEQARTGKYTPSALRSKEARMSSYFDMLDGSANSPVSYLGAKIGANIRAWQTMSKLGGVVLSALPDLALNAELFREHGASSFGGYAESFKGMFTGLSTAKKKELANLLGVWAENEIGGMVSRFAPFETPEGLTSRAMGRFFKLTLMEEWDKRNRVSVASYLSKNLAMNKSKSFNSLDTSLKSILQLYGIDAKQWDLIRNPENMFTIEDGSQFVTPDAALHYSDESIASYLDKDVSDLTKSEISKTKNDIYDRLFNFFVDQTENANLRPGIEDKYFFTRGSRAGTPLGEMARFIGQFKYYPIAYGKRIIGRKFFGLQNGLVDGASLDIQGLINIMIGTTALGYVSMNAKNIMKGRTIVPPDSWGAISAAMIQGGGMGIFGDFLLGQHDRFGHSITLDLLGPSITSIGDMATILFKLKSLEDPSNMAFAFLKNNTPFINLFYTRIFLDYAFLYGLQEKISPNSTRRYQAYLKKNTGQTLYLDPLAYSLI